MSKYRTAVIGCGAVSKNHGKALINNPDTEILFAVDSDCSKAEAFSKIYGGETLTDYRDLFSRTDLDSVHIVTPHYLHPEIAIDCMEHGLHVFCEKPLAIYPYDVKRMIGASKKTGKRLGVCFQNRLNPATIEAKELIESGIYGRIVSPLCLTDRTAFSSLISRVACLLPG